MIISGSTWFIIAFVLLYIDNVSYNMLLSALCSQEQVIKEFVFKELKYNENHTPVANNIADTCTSQYN